MTSKYEQLDAEAPLPFVRRKPDYKAETTKFVFERAKVCKKTTTKLDASGNATGKETEETEMMVTIKVSLKCFGNSAEEDMEHFFEAFERMQKTLDQEWEEAKGAKNRDATTLFHAFEEMLTGTANVEWHDVLANNQVYTWEMFKTKVAEFICTKVLPDHAYDTQMDYMKERGKPMKLGVEEWWLRFQTLNRYLPYFIPLMAALKREYDDATFSDWWRLGSMRKMEAKRAILNKAPKSWRQQLKRNDVGHDFRDNKTTTQLVNYFNVLEGEEKEQSKRRQTSKSDDRHGRRSETKRSADRRDRYTSERGNRYRNNGRQSDYYSRGRRDYQRSGGSHYRGQTNQEGTRDSTNRRDGHRQRSEDRNRYSQRRGDDHGGRRREEHHYQEEQEEQHLIDTWQDQFNMSESESSGSYHRSQTGDNFFYDEESSSGSEDRRGRR